MKKKQPKNLEITQEQVEWCAGCFLLSGVQNPFPSKAAEEKAFRELAKRGDIIPPYSKTSNPGGISRRLETQGTRMIGYPPYPWPPQKTIQPATPGLQGVFSDRCKTPQPGLKGAS